MKRHAHTCTRVPQCPDELVCAPVVSRAEVVRFLEPIGRGGRGNDEEGRALDQDGLSEAACLGECRQVLQQDDRARDDPIHDARPGPLSSAHPRRVEGERGKSERRKKRKKPARDKVGVRCTLYNISSWMPMLVSNTVMDAALLSACSRRMQRSGNATLSSVTRSILYTRRNTAALGEHFYRASRQSR